MNAREIADEFDGMSTRDLEQLAELLRKELERRASRPTRA